MEKESGEGNMQPQNSATSTAIFELMVQSDESIKELYNKIDVNHDNCLDKEEVVNYFKVLGCDSSFFHFFLELTLQDSSYGRRHSV
jgi:Ca2+-binding EF-hand superfamily protein